MAIKNIFESPTIADMVVIPILTPDSDGCFLADPFKVDNVKIFYISRNFNTPSNAELEEASTNEELLADLAAAKKAACALPTDFNLQRLAQLEAEVESNTKLTTTFFTEALSVGIFGTDDFPAWLSTDTGNAILIKVEEDEDGNPLIGNFELQWEPKGQREGDYIVCWTWTPLPAGDKLSANIKFSLLGSTKLTTVIPTHQTDPQKYTTLLDRYTAEMFKRFISQNDLTPPILQEFNKSVAKGFTFMEDLGNQLFDIIDANATPENFLPLLSNLFNLRLKSDDPTLWRRQIKQAVPLFKKKGTRAGLEGALDQAGMKLNKFTLLWQVVSQFTFQEAFDVVEDDQEDFTLSKVAILPVDIVNFELFHRGVDDDEYSTLTLDYVTLSTSGGITTMTWIGNQLSVNAISLSAGDTVRVIYEVIEVPAGDQAIETFIRTLPLADQRDERDQEFPSKNWNVRVIEEDDPLFDVVIPNRNPFREPVVLGDVRTEIAYSENIYNMEEYNGSKRESTDPCDINKDFLDDCTDCQGSKFNVDIEIDNLSNNRILEALDVVEEFVPFHAVLHTVNFSGAINDFIQVPVESIEILMTFSQEDMMISGNGANLIFNRVMLPPDQIERDMLADSSKVVSLASGTIHNDEISLFSPDVNLETAAIGSSNLLEVLAPSPNSGEYTLGAADAHFAPITGGDAISEPINQSDFTFRISNEILTDSSTDIAQDNQFTFEDENGEFESVKSVFDVDNDPDYSGGPWKISIPAFSDTYTILNIVPDNILELDDPGGTLPSSGLTGITYTLLDDTGKTIDTSSTGELSVRSRGKVDITGIVGPGGLLEDVRNLVKIGDYLLLSGTQFKVIEFVPDTLLEFYIDDYTDGDMAGVSIKILRRIIDNQTGKLSYRGLTLETLVDHEAGLGILNGVNAPVSEDDILEDNLFKQNFLVLVNPTTDEDFYTIEEIDGKTITLGGPHRDFTTLTAGGTPITYDIFKFEKVPTSIPERTEPPVPGHDFDFIDRRGNVVIDMEEETAMPMLLRAASLNAAKNDQIVELISQRESISFTIETAEGNVEKGDI